MPDLTPVPETVDPDHWLMAPTGKTYKRKLDSKGCFQLGNQTYYVQQSRRGQVVVIWVYGQKRTLNVYKDQVVIKTLAIKGLQNCTMKFREYLELMCKEAISAWRKAQHRVVRYG